MAVRQRNFWPTYLQRLLFRAAFLSGEAGIQAWEQWKSQVNMDDHPDPGSFQLLPQLYRNLQSLGIDDPLMMKLKGIVRRNWVKNQQFFRSHTPILQHLHEAGIESMLLGGAAIALRDYSDYALDHEIALEVLVQPEEAHNAIRLVCAQGWQPETRLPLNLIESYVAAGWTHRFRDALGRSIQLHWHLLPEARCVSSEQSFWQGAVSTNVSDVPVYTLNPTDQILQRCNRNILLPKALRFPDIVDVMFIMHIHADLDWERLIAYAQKFGLQLPVMSVLQYIQDNLDEPLPSDVWQHLEAQPVSRQERLEYQLRTSQAFVWRKFWSLWFSYSRCSPHTALPRRMMDFPRYLQHLWRLQRLWNLPVFALFVSLRRARRI